MPDGTQIDLHGTVLDLLARVQALEAAQAGRQDDGRMVRLAAAIESYFGGSPFTASGLVAAADTSDRLADALAEVIDLNLDRRALAVSVGLLLARQPWVEVRGQQRGAGLYRLRS